MTLRVEDDWHRLHPLTILKELGALAWAVAAALVFDFDFGPVPEQYASTETIIAVGVFGYAVTRYLFTAYRLTDQALELRRGVLIKQFQSMPRNRIQSVGVTTSLVGRFVGVTTVEVSAADAEDIRLGFVSEEAAGRLRTLLEPERGPVGEGEKEEAHPPRPLATLDVGRLLVFGLTEPGLVPAVVLLFAGVVAALALGWVAAPMAAGAIGFWPLVKTAGLAGFRSWLEGDRLRVEAGVLGRRQNTAPLERIQTLQVKRPPLRRILGLETVSIVTGDVAISSENVVTAGTVAPLEPTGEWRRLAAELIGEVELGESDLERSSPLVVRRTLVRGIGASLVPAAAATLWQWWLGPVLLVGAGIISLLYGRARWRVLGWAADDQHLIVRRGVVNRSLTVVPVRKVQDVTIRQTFFQRRLNLATVEVDTAGVTFSGNLKAIDLDLPDAQDVAGRLASLAALIALPDGV